VIVSDPDGRLQKYPVGSGAPVIVAGAEPGDEPLVWSRDGGSIWVLSRSTRPAKIFRIDLKPAQRTFWHDVPYPDPAATDFGNLRVVITPDGSKFVYGYQKRSSELYVAEGLR